MVLNGRTASAAIGSRFASRPIAAKVLTDRGANAVRCDAVPRGNLATEIELIPEGEAIPPTGDLVLPIESAAMDNGVIQIVRTTLDVRVAVA